MRVGDVNGRGKSVGRAAWMIYGRLAQQAKQCGKMYRASRGRIRPAVGPETQGKRGHGCVARKRRPGRHGGVPQARETPLSEMKSL